jgi:glycosyltransferase involved in cell wall biosynthesis
MTNSRTFPGRLGIQQRVLPEYRRGFFDALAEACEGGLSVFAGDVDAGESIPTTDQLNSAEILKARNRHIGKVQSPYYFLWQGGLLDWLSDWNPDVLIVEANPRYLSTGRAINWMHERSKPVIGWGLGAPPIEREAYFAANFISAWRNKSRRGLISKLDAVIAYSHRGAGEYSSLTSASKKVYAATNAVASRPIGSPPKRTPGFADQGTVLFVGRLQSRKRIDNLLRACTSLPESMQPQLKIVGDGPEREILSEMAKNVYPKADFPGKKQGLELEKCFLEADLFVLPGTGGLAVQEAMAFGLPVIVAEGDGTQADLVRSDNGWLISANDELTLKQSLEEALSDPVKLRKMGDVSFKIVQDEINIEQMVSVFIQALNSTKFSPEDEK